MTNFEGIGALREKEYAELIREWKNHPDPVRDTGLAQAARATCDQSYGKQVFIRGLIEVSSYCKQNCLYCGLRRGNRKADRYRLTKEQILACCHIGQELGFHSFVLQGGEDEHFTDHEVCNLVTEIKELVPGCAITLSLGEKEKASYKAFFEAGADRYLLRHETANGDHFSRLHPTPQTFASRRECLYNLKEIGFQTGAGFMVGSPWQTPETLAEDLVFLRELQPHMVGIGPFIPHEDTPLGGYPAGSAEETLRMLGLVRLLLPKAMLPATTALGSIHPAGREMGLLSGANVVMPNLSPPEVRDAYSIYNGKLKTGPEAAENLAKLEDRINGIGLEPCLGRGDYNTMG